MPVTAEVTSQTLNVEGKLRKAYSLITLDGTYDTANISLPLASLLGGYYNAGTPTSRILVAGPPYLSSSLGPVQPLYFTASGVLVLVMPGFLDDEVAVSAHTHTIPAHTPTITVGAGTVTHAAGFDSGAVFVAGTGGTITANEVAATNTGSDGDATLTLPQASFVTADTGGGDDVTGDTLYLVATILPP